MQACRTNVSGQQISSRQSSLRIRFRYTDSSPQDGEVSFPLSCFFILFHPSSFSFQVSTASGAMIAVAQAWRPLRNTLVAPHETADAEWGRPLFLLAWRRFVGGDGARPGERGSWEIETEIGVWRGEEGRNKQRSMMRLLMLKGREGDSDRRDRI
jgi:hypothetical protein